LQQIYADFIVDINFLKEIIKDKIKLNRLKMNFQTNKWIKKYKDKTYKSNIIN
jgi:hypothetical protein